MRQPNGHRLLTNLARNASDQVQKLGHGGEFKECSVHLWLMISYCNNRLPIDINSTQLALIMREILVTYTNIHTRNTQPSDLETDALINCTVNFRERVHHSYYIFSVIHLFRLFLFDRHPEILFMMVLLFYRMDL